MKTPSEAAREYAEKCYPTDVCVGPITANMNRDRRIAAEEAFLAGVAWAERWISVENELPEAGTEVLVKYSDEKVFMACYENSQFGWKCYEPAISRWYALEDRIITHWRPIEHGKE